LLYSSAAQCWDVLCELILAARYSYRDDLLPEFVPPDQRVLHLPDCAALRTWSLQTCASRQSCSLQPICGLPTIDLPRLIGLSLSICALLKFSLLQHGFEFRQPFSCCEPLPSGRRIPQHAGKPSRRDVHDSLMPTDADRYAPAILDALGPKLRRSAALALPPLHVLMDAH
jgi:hypothetical protein